jgi:glycolate oxidase FAD binding subunit
VSENGSLSWPDPPAAGPLGDDRNAIASIHPGSVEELCEAVRDHVGQGHAIYPQGGSTALDYGGIPAHPGVAIDTRSLSGVIDYPHADMTITLQAGITAAALRGVLAGKNQRLLIDIPRAERATLGGVFATNTCGPRRYGLGRPRDQILGVSFVTSEGIEVKGGGRVVKNVAGYDFPRLLTGSMGSLGIITQMTLKVRPLPEASAIVWKPVPILATLGATLDALNTSGSRPVALEVLSPSAAKSVGEVAKLPANEWILAIGLEDNAASVRWQIDRLRGEIGEADLTVLQDNDAAPLWAALTEYPAAEIGPFSCVANLRPSAVVRYLGQLDPGRWALQAHAGNGIIRMHAVGEWTLDQASDEVARLRALAAGNDGSLVVARCPTAWKDRLRVWGAPRPDWRLAELVRQALDPKGVMNPGRFVAGL